MKADPRVLMIAFNFPPSTTAGVHRTLRFAKYLPENHCIPTILTRNAEVEPGGAELLQQVPESVCVWRVGRSSESTSEPAANVSQPKPALSLKRRVKRWLKPFWELATETPDQHIQWSRLAGNYALARFAEQQFDVVYTTGPPHSTHLAGFRIHKKTGIPWIADFRDPWARRPWVKARNPIGQKFLKHFESRVAHHATMLILNNDASEADFRAAYPTLAPEKFHSLPNGFDPELLDLVGGIRTNLSEQAPAHGGIPVICHPGALYGQRDPSAILKAIASLHNEGLSVRLQQIGFCSNNYPPDKLAADMGIGHLVEVIPQVSHRKALEYMAASDVLMVIQPKGPLMVPGKLYEMLMFDQPIVGVCDGQATNMVLASAGRAWASASDDPAAIAFAIRSALQSNDSELMKRAQARETYNGRYLCRKFADLIRACLGANQLTNCG